MWGLVNRWIEQVNLKEELMGTSKRRLTKKIEISVIVGLISRTHSKDQAQRIEQSNWSGNIVNLS